MRRRAAVGLAPFGDARSVLQEAVQTLRGHGWRTGSVTALVAATVVLQVAAPQFAARFLDVATHPAGPATGLWGLAGGFVGASAAAQGLRIAAVRQAAWLGADVGLGMRRRLMLTQLRSEMAAHDRGAAGEVVEQLDGDVAVITQFYAQGLVAALQSSLLLVGVLAAVAARSAIVASALLAFVGIALVILHALRGMGIERFGEERAARAELGAFLEERLAARDDIVPNGGVVAVLADLEDQNASVTRAGQCANRVATLVSVFAANGAFVVGFALALSLGVWLHEVGRGSLGFIYLLTQYAVMIRAPMDALGSEAVRLQRVAVSFQRLRGASAPVPVIDATPRIPPPVSAPAVDCRRVDFGYRDEEPVLRGVDFQLATGESLAVLGRTGSGKSTLVQILAGLRTPHRGQVLLAGQDLNSWRENDLRTHVGVVTQDVAIFSGSLRDNLTMFDRSMPDRRVLEALDQLGLLAWARSQPDGLDTALGAGGLQMSAGEAQLVAFARLGLRDPALVILDEPSSRLDVATSRLLETAFEAMLASGPGGRPRTGIVVAHRLETVRRMSRVLILEQGSVVESGPQAILRADPASRLSQLSRSALAR